MRSKRVIHITAPLASVMACSMVFAKTPIETYNSQILPMLEKHCYECHGDGYDKGKVAFDLLETDKEILDPTLWLRVLNNVRAGLMPAEDNPRLNADEQATLERWIKRDVFHIDPARPDPGRVTVRRLNRVEYRNTVKDLLGVDYNTDHEFPPDDTGFGFDNIGDALTTSPMLMEKYVAAAQTVIAQAVPTVVRKPAIRTEPGTVFEGEGAGFKWGRRQLTFNTPADVAAKFRTDLAGTYRVKLDLEVNGSYYPDPGKARVVVKVDGQEMVNEEFAYHDEKAFTFERSQKWPAGSDHVVTIELTPTVPEEKKETIVDFFVNRLHVEGPLETAQWVKTENYDRYFPREVPKSREARRAYAEELLTAFATKAYRRPVSDNTGERLAALAEATYTQKGKTFEQGVAHAMSAVLASPRFLFKLEEAAPNAVGGVAEVDEYSLASRLSYFLWSTMPDDELIALAGRGELRKNLAAQVERMLKDPRAENLARNFTGQWLQARDVEGIASNPQQVILRDVGEEETQRQLRQAFMKRDFEAAKRLNEYIETVVKSKPEFNKDMRKAMREETEKYFEYVAREDRPVTEFLESNYTFLNEDLAKFYGVPDVVGKEMRKVTLPAGNPRGGMLTQGSALVVTSNPDRTSPVKRGLFVLANFLGTPPPPPPANVPALEASETDFKDGHEPTLRDVLKVHRENPMCASCHNRMDPIGLAFENFNAVGAWRDSERKQPIVPEGSLITGETFKSVNELKRILVTDHREEFYRTLTGKLMTYATGRGVEYYDVETIDQIVKRLEEDGGRFSSLLTGIIESAPFQKMRTTATVTAAN